MSASLTSLVLGVVAGATDAQDQAHGHGHDQGREADHERGRDEQHEPDQRDAVLDGALDQVGSDLREDDGGRGDDDHHQAAHEGVVAALDEVAAVASEDDLADDHDDLHGEDEPEQEPAGLVGRAVLVALVLLADVLEVVQGHGAEHVEDDVDAGEQGDDVGHVAELEEAEHLEGRDDLTHSGALHDEREVAEVDGEDRTDRGDHHGHAEEPEDDVGDGHVVVGGVAAQLRPVLLAGEPDGAVRLGHSALGVGLSARVGRDSHDDSDQREGDQEPPPVLDRVREDGVGGQFDRGRIHGDLQGSRAVASDREQSKQGMHIRGCANGQRDGPRIHAGSSGFEVLQKACKAEFCQHTSHSH